MKRNILCVLLATSLSIGAMIMAGDKASERKEVQPVAQVQVTQDRRLSRGGTFNDSLNVNAEENIEARKTEQSSQKVETQQTEKNSNEVESDAVSKEKQKPKIETLDWWEEAQYIFPRGAVAEIQDVYTGRTFNIKRTFGTNHADCEALTSEDTEVIKEIWGGFSWERRPIIVNIEGRRIAASMAAMPHAGKDSAPALAVATNLSAGYGTGQNLDLVKGNGMDGVFDVHFLGSKRHKDGKVQAVVDPQHQEAIEIAAGTK